MNHIPFPLDFSNQVEKAIPLVGNNGKIMDDNELFQFLVKNEIDSNSAIEIVIFLPIAFFRCMLTNVVWPESYKVQSDSSIQEKKYNETETFKIILEETTKYLKNNPNQDIILGVAGRSAEFRATNKLLLDNPKLDIQDLHFTEAIVNRQFLKGSS